MTCHLLFRTENVTARGERLELLVNKTENLRDTSVSFRKTSRNLARAMFWNNIKMVRSFFFDSNIEFQTVFKIFCSNLSFLVFFFTVRNRRCCSFIHHLCYCEHGMRRAVVAAVCA